MSAVDKDSLLKYLRGHLESTTRPRLPIVDLCVCVCVYLEKTTTHLAVRRERERELKRSGQLLFQIDHKEKEHWSAVGGNGGRGEKGSKAERVRRHPAYWRKIQLMCNSCVHFLSLPPSLLPSSLLVFPLLNYTSI